MTEHWLTVITVVKDAADDLARTASSLATQQSSGLEGVDYVVIDSSGDRAEIPGVLAGIALPTTTLEWIAPSGIYPAMNAGLAAATGTFAYFLNAGDTLHDPMVLADVRAALAGTDHEWAFGDVEIVDRGGHRVVTPSWDYPDEKRHGFSTGHFAPHQGTFARTQTLRRLGSFDTSYAIAADYAMFLRLTCESDPLVLSRTIATFTEGGVSTTRWKESFAEFRRARAEILDIHGAAALRMHANAAWQFASVYAYREVLHRGAR